MNICDRTFSPTVSGPRLVTGCCNNLLECARGRHVESFVTDLYSGPRPMCYQAEIRKEKEQFAKDVDEWMKTSVLARTSCSSYHEDDTCQKYSFRETEGTFINYEGPTVYTA